MREIQPTDWSTAGEQGKLVLVTCALRENLSNQSTGVQILHDICTHFGRYLYSAKCSWIIKLVFVSIHFQYNIAVVAVIRSFDSHKQG